MNEPMFRVRAIAPVEVFGVQLCAGDEFDCVGADRYRWLVANRIAVDASSVVEEPGKTGEAPATSETQPAPDTGTLGTQHGEENRAPAPVSSRRKR